MEHKLMCLYQTDFLAFASKAILELEGRRITRDGYLKVLADKATEFANGDIRKLQINLPPRHLKTLLFAICLPAWILGHSPTTKIMLLACSEKLAEKTARKIRAIMKSSWFGEVFATRIAAGQAKAMDFATTAGGGVFAASLYSNITGRGADVIIVDDLHPIPDAGKPQKLAQSIALFENFITSRRNNPAKDRLLVIGHRISENDIFAHLRTQKRWTRVVLPLVATRDVVYETAYGTWHRRKGEPLRPDAFDEDEIERLKATNVNPDFEFLYQQDEAHARIAIAPEHFRTFTSREYQNLRCVISIEPGVDNGESFSVVQAWAFDVSNMYLIDQFREQCELDELRRAAQKFRSRHRPEVVLVENTANGRPLISALRRKWKRHQLIVPITPRGSKSSRFRRHVDKILDGHVWLREHGAFREDFVDEMVAFPHGPNSDQVDAFTQGADWIDDHRYLAKQPRNNPPFMPMVIADRWGGFEYSNPGTNKPDAPGICVGRGNSAVPNPWRSRW